MRLASRIDDNQHEIVQALRKAGAYVRVITQGDGLPDILVGFNGKTILMEIKDGNKRPSEQRLTKAEEKFHNEWTGGRLAVVNSVFMALQELAQPEVADNTGS